MSKPSRDVALFAQAEMSASLALGEKASQERTPRRESEWSLGRDDPFLAVQGFGNASKVDAADRFAHPLRGPLECRHGCLEGPPAHPPIAGRVSPGEAGPHQGPVRNGPRRSAPGGTVRLELYSTK